MYSQHDDLMRPYVTLIDGHIVNMDDSPIAGDQSRSRKRSLDHSSADSLGKTSYEGMDDEELEELLEVSSTMSLSSDLIIPERRGRNNNRTSRQSSGAMKLFRQDNGVALDLPWKYGNLIAKAFNNHDNLRLRRLFSEYCSPDCVVLKRVYESARPKTKNPKNYFGKWSTTSMDLATFCDYSQSFDIIVPDSIMDVGHHRSCYEREVSVFMSAFHYNGTIIAADSNLVETDKESGKVTSVKEIDEQRVVHTALVPSRITLFKAQGSMALYIRNGQIYCLEFFYEFL